MEGQQDTPQQNTPHVQQQPMVTSKSSLPVVVVTIILTAIVVGVGVFLWQNQQYQQQIGQMQDQLENVVQESEEAQKDLEEKVSMLEQQLYELDATPQNKTCLDSDVNEKPDDIYIKGSVTFTDSQGNETSVFDECTGSKTQVNEMWCYESPAGSGDYVQGKMVYDCKNGCLDGACILN